MSIEEAKRLAHELTMEYVKYNKTIWNEATENIGNISDYYEKAYRMFYETLIHKNM